MCNCVSGSDVSSMSRLLTFPSHPNSRHLDPPEGEGLGVRNSGQLQNNVRITVCGDGLKGEIEINHGSTGHKKNEFLVNLKYFAVDYDISWNLPLFII